MHAVIKSSCCVCRKLAVMTGTVLSVTVVGQWLIVPNVGEFIMQIAFLLQTALKELFLYVPFARFVRLNTTLVYMIISSRACSGNIQF